MQLTLKLPSFGSYSSSIGAHCFALRASSLENFTFTLSIKGYVISQKPSRSLSSGVGSPAGVRDFDYSSMKRTKQSLSSYRDLPHSLGKAHGTASTSLAVVDSLRQSPHWYPIAYLPSNDSHPIEGVCCKCRLWIWWPFLPHPIWLWILGHSKSKA